MDHGYWKLTSKTKILGICPPLRPLLQIMPMCSRLEDQASVILGTSE